MRIFDLESHKFADIFPLIEGEELENLKQDIKEHGQIEPVVLYEGKILDGRNRYRACKELGLDVKTEEYKGKKPLEFVISLNLKRRHLTQSQKAVIGLDILPLLEEEAKKRHDNPFGVPQETEGLGEKSHHPLISTGKARDQVGKIMQVDGSYVQQAKKLKETSPELFEEVRLGHKNFSEIKKEQRAEKIQKQREELKKESLEQPIGLYDVIVIDPPWEYSRIGSSYDPEGNRAQVPYPEMSMDRLKKIKIPAKENCILWLWTTNAFMKEAYELLNIWGFQDKTILTWDKQFLGAGWWLRNITEHCILAIKGEPRRTGVFKNEKWTTLISEKRTEHSAKPELFYKMVEEICAGRKLDYFARKKRQGWDVYGDEIK